MSVVWKDCHIYIHVAGLFLSMLWERLPKIPRKKVDSNYTISIDDQLD